MTNLQPRKMDFGFEDQDVPFLWNPENPAWSSMSNAVSFLAIGFEKMIVKMIMQTKSRISDPEVAEEAGEIEVCSRDIEIGSGAPGSGDEVT